MTLARSPAPPTGRYRRAHAPEPATAEQVAARESGRRRRLIRLWLREWRRIRPGVARA